MFHMASHLGALRPVRTPHMMLASEEACRDQSPTGGWQDKTYIWLARTSLGAFWACPCVYKKSTVHSATNQSINIIQAMLSCGGGDVEHVPLSKPAIEVTMITVCSG